MANSRFYSSTAQQATLTGGASSSDVTIAVSSTAGFPGSTPYTLALDYGSSNEELVEVTNVSSLTLTVTRAIDGTSASSHAVGAFVRHVSSARDFTDSRTHEASLAAHGATGAVVGTTNSQTLTNKTLTKALGSLQNITMFNAGALGITTIIGDSVNPSASRLEIKDNEVALNTMVFFQSTGTIKSVRNTGDTEGAYKFRVTDNDAVTDRIAILAGGTIGFTPTAATTFPAVDVIAPNTSTTQRSMRLAASGGGTERFTIFNDGHTIIAGTAAAQNQLTVKAAASQSVDTFRVADSSNNSLFVVQSTGITVANKGAVIAQPGVTSGPVLQVGGSNLGYTGNLEQWVGPANNIVANIDEQGNFTAANIVPGAWISYTPTWTSTGTQPTLGNGTLLGRYQKFSRTVHVVIDLTPGSTTTFGTSFYSFALPFTTANAGQIGVGAAHLSQAGSRTWGQMIIGSNASTTAVFLASSATNISGMSGTSPVTFASGDSLRMSLTYESNV